MYAHTETIQGRRMRHLRRITARAYDGWGQGMRVRVSTGEGGIREKRASPRSCIRGRAAPDNPRQFGLRTESPCRDDNRIEFG
ncbi:MAG: hypothetical protein ACLP9L_11135, partial [Thermoguttaceae bacterium]